MACSNCHMLLRRVGARSRYEAVDRARGGRKCKTLLSISLSGFCSCPFHYHTIYFLSLRHGVVMPACPSSPRILTFLYKAILTSSNPQTSLMLLRQTPRRLHPHSRLVQLYPAPLRSCERPANDETSTRRPLVTAYLRRPARSFAFNQLAQTRIGWEAY